MTTHFARILSVFLLVLGLGTLNAGLPQKLLGDRLNPPKSGEFPSPRKVLRQMRAGTMLSYDDDDDDDENSYNTEISFVHVEKGGESWTWGPNGSYTATIEIDRYYGTRKEIQTMVNRGLMNQTAILVLPHNDCDDDAVIEDYAPEIDNVYLNGEYLGPLHGANNAIRTSFFEIPLEALNFPSRPGAVGKNELEIRVDTANTEPVWVLGQSWQMLVIPAPRPALLVHGWTDDQATLSQLGKALSKEIGLASASATLPSDNPPLLNAGLLEAQLVALTSSWKVAKFNLLAHSKGGLDSRVLIDKEGLKSDYVENLLQISTPNGGSIFADAIFQPRNFLEKCYSWLGSTTGLGSQDDEGLQSLTTESMRAFNRQYRHPKSPLHTVTGVTDPDALSPKYQIPQKVVETSAANDGMVEFTSAHCLGTAIGCSPFYTPRSNRYDHSNIVRDGAVDVVTGFRPYLGKRPEITPRHPEYGDVTASARRQMRGTATPADGTADTSAPAELRRRAPESAMESAMLAVGDHRIITHEFYALTGGEVTVGLMPCPTGISATLLYPDGSTTVQLSSESLGTLMRGGYILSAELQNAPTGKYTLQIDGTQCAESAVAKFLFREPGQDQVTLALDCTKSVPLTPTPLLTARVVKDGSTYTAAPLSLEVKISPRESAELSIQSLPMHDDGLDGDATAGDGIYTARVPDGSTPGKWEATLEATIPVGEAFVHRLGYLYFEVGDGTTAGSFTLPFTEEVIRKKDSSLIQKVCFGSQVTVGQPGEYQLNADLCDGNGKHFSCVSTRWVSEKAESRQVVLDLDPAELQESGVEGPWYLSDVELIYWPHSARTEYPQTIANSEIVQAISSVRTLYEMRTWLFRVSIGGSGVETLSDGRDAHAPKRLTIEIPATIEGEIPPEVRTGSFCMYSPTRQLLASLSANLVPSASGDGSWTIIATMEPNAFRYVNEDGPYTISNGMLQMRMPDNTVRFFEIQGSYETKPYSKELFHYVKPQNMEPQGRNLQIHLQTPGTPDGTGAHIYKATLRYTMPDPDEPIQDDGRGFAPGCAANPENKYFVWDKAGYIDFILQGNLDYIINDFSRSGYCLDVTEQVQEKLRQVGNRDGLFDPGETIEVEVELWNGGTELAEETAQKDLAFAIANRGLTLREANFTRVLHPFDRDKDWVISEAELAKGKEMWAESKVRPQLLLEGITLCGSTQYDYDKAAKKFVAGSRSLKP